MASTSPLEHEELRHIEQRLDDGNTSEAAALLARLGHVNDHKDAIDFLTTRLLFQRGRIDSAGAADRLATILGRVSQFPEAEDWLAELEARTERSALATPMFPDPPGEEFDDTRPTQPPPSRAPSVPRKPERLHPYVDEASEEDVTPADALAEGTATIDELRLDSSDPPPLPRFSSLPPEAEPFDDESSDHTPADGEFSNDDASSTEPPPSPEVQRAQSSDPPTHPELARAIRTETPTRPSYKPFDSLRAKEQLSAEAGRYRGEPREPSGDPNPPRPKTRSPAASTPPGASSLDLEGRIEMAFECLRQGRGQEAMALLPEETAPANLAPELRVMLARVLLDAGHAERAALEATMALERAPDSAATRLVFVWSAVRYARQRDDAWSLEKAGRALKSAPLAHAPEAGLVDALTACVEARVGVPSVALRLAQRALRSNSESLDGLAALAEAAALCGEERRAEVALERLFSISESAAEQIAPRLLRLGVGEHGPTSSTSVWLRLEHTLASGAREVTLTGIEALAGEALRDLGVERWEDAGRVARTAGEFLAQAPVFRHFGLYDVSLRSIERLDVGLGLLYGSGPRALDVNGASQRLWQVAGLYLGETLRQCCEGRWSGNPRQLEDATLHVLGTEVQPFALVRHRIAHGRHATLHSALAGILERAPAAAHDARSVPVVSPPNPWGDRDWPTLGDLPRLGRALGHSVVATYCAEQGQGPLDRSSPSLTALDRYLELVAPNGGRVLADSWTRWLSVFLGAYLGEVLCKEFGGAWRAAEQPEAREFVVQFQRRQVEPVQLVLEAIVHQRPACLADYVSGLRRASILP